MSYTLLCRSSTAMGLVAEGIHPVPTGTFGFLVAARPGRATGRRESNLPSSNGACAGLEPTSRACRSCVLSFVVLSLTPSRRSRALYSKPGDHPGGFRYLLLELRTLMVLVFFGSVAVQTEVARRVSGSG